MPVIIKPPPIKPVDLSPKPPALTREDVQAMLAERDAMWAGKLAAMQTTLMAAIAAAKPAPRKGATITFETDHRGVITSANLIPKD